VIKLELLKLTDKAYDQYKRFVRHNEDITRELAEKKLTRNVMLAKEIEPRGEFEKQIGNRAWQYGNLLIITRRDKVVHIWNTKGINGYKNWELDKVKYYELSKELGIID
jgi:phosphopentomutase